MIDSQTTVREIAIQVPEATRLFEKFKIDYCCGGNRPLTYACRLAGVNVDNVIEILAKAGQSKPETNVGVSFPDLFLSDLVNYIVDTHHVFTKDEMNRLAALTDKVISAHGVNHSEPVGRFRKRSTSAHSSGKQHSLSESG